jgi:hypothetical protein
MTGRFFLFFFIPALPVDTAIGINESRFTPRLFSGFDRRCMMPLWSLLFSIGSKGSFMFIKLHCICLGEPLAITCSGFYQTF